MTIETSNTMNQTAVNADMFFATKKIEATEAIKEATVKTETAAPAAASTATINKYALNVNPNIGFWTKENSSFIGGSELKIGKEAGNHLLDAAKSVGKAFQTVFVGQYEIARTEKQIVQVSLAERKAFMEAFVARRRAASAELAAEIANINARVAAEMKASVA